MAEHFNIVEGEDLAGEIGFDDVLEQRQHGLIEHAAAGFKVRIDMARVRRVLPPVRELVRVCVEDRVQSERLHGAHLGDSRGTGMRRQREGYTRRRKESGDFGYPRANRTCPRLNAKRGDQPSFKWVVGSERRDTPHESTNDVRPNTPTTGDALHDCVVQWRSYAAGCAAAI